MPQLIPKQRSHREVAVAVVPKDVLPADALMGHTKLGHHPLTGMVANEVAASDGVEIKRGKAKADHRARRLGAVALPPEGRTHPVTNLPATVLGVGVKAHAANQFPALLQTDRKPTRHPSPLASDVFLRALGILYGAAGLDLKRRRTSANPCRSTQCLARGRAENHPQFAVPRATPLNSRAQRAHGLGVVRPKTLQCRKFKNDVAAIHWGARQPRTPIYQRRF